MWGWILGTTIQASADGTFDIEAEGLPGGRAAITVMDHERGHGRHVVIDVDLAKVTKVLFGNEWWDVHPGSLVIDQVTLATEDDPRPGETSPMAFRFVGSSLGESRVKGQVTGVLSALQAMIE
jgi:hypothetical protein